MDAESAKVYLRWVVGEKLNRKERKGFKVVVGAVPVDRKVSFHLSFAFVAPFADKALIRSIFFPIRSIR